jgi:hypothetical protein
MSQHYKFCHLQQTVEKKAVFSLRSLESKSNKYESSLDGIHTYNSEFDLKADRLPLDTSSASGESTANARCSPKRLSALNAYH